MEGADALGLIAEVGIAIAGFVGIVVALRAQGEPLRAYEALQVGTLLGVSAEAVLLALLPFALHFVGLGSAMTWALSSAAMLILLGTLQVVTFRLARRLQPGVRPPRETARMAIGTVMLGSRATARRFGRPARSRRVDAPGHAPARHPDDGGRSRAGHRCRPPEAPPRPMQGPRRGPPRHSWPRRRDAETPAGVRS